MVSSIAERMDWDPDVLIFRDDAGRRIVPYGDTTENYDKDEARDKSGRWASGVQYDEAGRVTTSIDPHEHVQIHDSATGEIYWHGPRHEAEDMLREQSEVEPDNTLRIVSYDQSAHAAQQSLEEVRRRQHDEVAAEAQRQETLKTPFGLLPGHRDYVEPPSTLYHATLDPNKIATGGFKSSDELGYQTLGGSSSHLVSFTTKSNAEKYAQALDVSRKAAQGKLGDADLVKVGQRYGVSEEKMHEILDRTEGAKDKSFSVLQAVSMEGKKFPLFMGTSWPQHLKTAGPPALVSVPSSDVKSIYYNPGEHEWRLGDLSNLKPTIVKNEDPSRFGLLPAPPPPVFAWPDEVHNFDPDQPRDDSGKWTAGASLEDGEWQTLHGIHLHIKKGKIVAGPKSLMGHTPTDYRSLNDEAFKGLVGAMTASQKASSTGSREDHAEAASLHADVAHLQSLLSQHPDNPAPGSNDNLADYSSKQAAEHAFQADRSGSSAMGIKEAPVHYTYDKGTEDDVKALFPNHHLADVFGALGVTNGATVRVSVIRDHSSGSSNIDVQVNHPEYSARRTIVSDRNLLVNSSFNATTAGRGTGTRILSHQIEAAQKIGMLEMSTHAVGSKSTAEAGGNSGSVVWPKMGYDGPVTLAFKEDLKRAGVSKELYDSRTLHELLSKPGGRKALEEHYDGGQLTFDLRSGSPHLKIFDAYLKERARRGQG